MKASERASPLKVRVTTKLGIMFIGAGVFTAALMGLIVYAQFTPALLVVPILAPMALLSVFLGLMMLADVLGRHKHTLRNAHDDWNYLTPAPSSLIVGLAALMFAAVAIGALIWPFVVNRPADLGAFAWQIGLAWIVAFICGLCAQSCFKHMYRARFVSVRWNSTSLQVTDRFGGDHRLAFDQIAHVYASEILSALLVKPINGGEIRLSTEPYGAEALYLTLKHALGDRFEGRIVRFEENGNKRE